MKRAILEKLISDIPLSKEEYLYVVHNLDDKSDTALPPIDHTNNQLFPACGISKEKHHELVEDLRSTFKDFMLNHKSVSRLVEVIEAKLINKLDIRGFVANYVADKISQLRGPENPLDLLIRMLKNNEEKT